MFFAKQLKLVRNGQPKTISYAKLVKKTLPHAMIKYSIKNREEKLWVFSVFFLLLLEYFSHQSSKIRIKKKKNMCIEHARNVHRVSRRHAFNFYLRCSFALDDSNNNNQNLYGNKDVITTTINMGTHMVQKTKW